MAKAKGKAKEKRIVKYDDKVANPNNFKKGSIVSARGTFERG